MTLHKLSDAFVRKEDLAPGRYSDGGNLYLSVNPAMTKSWVFMYSRNKQPRREMGLGPYPGMSLSMARQKAAEARSLLLEGIDPLDERHRESSHRYTVIGKWPFPYDMVRYDGSRPATEADEELIALYSGDHAPDRSVFKGVAIDLVGPRRPNVARWESFGWSVPSENPRQVVFDESRRPPARPKTDNEIREAALKKLSPEERRVLGLQASAV